MVEQCALKKKRESTIEKIRKRRDVDSQLSSHTFVKDSPPRQGSYKEMSGESKGVIG